LIVIFKIFLRNINVSILSKIVFNDLNLFKERNNDR
jgi:hypothetical protein